MRFVEAQKLIGVQTLRAGLAIETFDEASPGRETSNVLPRMKAPRSGSREMNSGPLVQTDRLWIADLSGDPLKHVVDIDPLVGKVDVNRR